MMYSVPKDVDGILVKPSGKPTFLSGEHWITLIPVDQKDQRVWMYNINTGKIKCTAV